MASTRDLSVLSAALVAASASAQWVTPPVEAERVEQRFFESEAAGTTVSYHVYTPPQYDLEPIRRFPVVYWLHGAGAVTLSIAPISAWFHAAIERGDIPPLILVMPNGMPYRMWCDSLDGTVLMERVVMDDLLPEVNRVLRTIPDRAARIIEGFSMGGHGAARLGLRRPDLFAGISMFGAGPLQEDFLDAPRGSNMPLALRLQIYESVWGSSPEYYTLQHPRTIAFENAQSIIAEGTALRIAIGGDDVLVPMNMDFHALLNDLQIPHTFSIHPGIAHQTLPLLSALGEENWSYYRSLFERFEPHPGDLNGDGVIDLVDLLQLLAAWGPCAGCDEDLDGDRAVSLTDLLLLLSSWGPAW